MDIEAKAIKLLATTAATINSSITTDGESSPRLQSISVVESEQEVALPTPAASRSQSSMEESNPCGDQLEKQMADDRNDRESSPDLGEPPLAVVEKDYPATENPAGSEDLLHSKEEEPAATAATAAAAAATNASAPAAPSTSEHNRIINRNEDQEDRASQSGSGARRPYTDRVDGDQKARLYVGNLGDGVNDSVLHRIFEVYGRIQGIAYRGRFAFIQFERQRDMQRALEGERGRLKLYGRYVDVTQYVVNHSLKRTRSPSPPPLPAQPSDRSTSGSRLSNYRNNSDYDKSNGSGISGGHHRGSSGRDDNINSNNSNSNSNNHNNNNNNNNNNNGGVVLATGRQSPSELNRLLPKPAVMPDIQIFTLEFTPRAFVSTVEETLKRGGYEYSTFILASHMRFDDVVKHMAGHGIWACLCLKPFDARNDLISSLQVFQTMENGGFQSKEFLELNYRELLFRLNYLRKQTQYQQVQQQRQKQSTAATANNSKSNNNEKEKSENSSSSSSLSSSSNQKTVVKNEKSDKAAENRPVAAPVASSAPVLPQPQPIVMDPMVAAAATMHHPMLNNSLPQLAVLLSQQDPTQVLTMFAGYLATRPHLLNQALTMLQLMLQQHQFQQQLQQQQIPPFASMGLLPAQPHMFMAPGAPQVAAAPTGIVSMQQQPTQVQPQAPPPPQQAAQQPYAMAQPQQLSQLPQQQQQQPSFPNLQVSDMLQQQQQQQMNQFAQQQQQKHLETNSQSMNGDGGDSAKFNLLLQNLLSGAK